MSGKMSGGKVIFILFVSDQERSKCFYRTVLGDEPVLDVAGMTEFELTASSVLGIMPEEGITKILGNENPSPKAGSGIPRCEVYLYVDDPDNYYDRVIEAGGHGISRAAVRSWGDCVSSCSDLDGHIVAFAKK